MRMFLVKPRGYFEFAFQPYILGNLNPEQMTLSLWPPK
jgi:hypothetical protein